MVTILDNHEIDQVLTPKLCLRALEEAYEDLANGKASTMLGREMVTTRLTDVGRYDVGEGETYYTLEPQTGLVPRYGVGAVRIKSDVMHWSRVGGVIRRTKVPAAPDHRYCGLIMLFDIRSCAPTALLPDGMIQRMRVGATSALGVKYLARPDARTVGLIGAGWQAGAQLLTVAEIRSIRRIKVFSPNPQRREAFAAEISKQLGLDVQPVASPEAVATDVDILLSATNSRTPTITADMVRPGMHIGVISVEEIGEDALRKVQVLGVPQRLRLGANHWAIAEGSAAHIHERSFEHGWWRNEALWERFVELGDLIHDRGRGRRQAADATFFMAGGDGIQFAAVGAKVLEAAATKGLGRALPLDWFTQPYPS